MLQCVNRFAKTETKVLKRHFLCFQLHTKLVTSRLPHTKQKTHTHTLLHINTQHYVPTKLYKYISFSRSYSKKIKEERTGIRGWQAGETVQQPRGELTHLFWGRESRAAEQESDVSLLLRNNSYSNHINMFASMALPPQNCWECFKAFQLPETSHSLSYAPPPPPWPLYN